MQLTHINYWSGKIQKSVIVLSIGIQGGKLIGLKSDKLADNDIKLIRANYQSLCTMDGTEAKQWLSKNIPRFDDAYCELVKGRYKIMESFNI